MKYTSKPYTAYSFDNEKAPSPSLPPRPERSSKGDFGRVLCVCGSYGMSGAAFLAAKSAYRSGCGLVEIFTPECNRIILQTLIPEAVLTVYTEVTRTQLLRDAIERADCIVTGCGLSVTTDSRALLSDLLHMWDSEKCPLLIDADGLNLLSRNPSLLRRAKGAVITPHAKEMSRLCGKSVEEILASPADTAYAFANSHGVVCVLKDHNTIVSDGTARLYVNKSGNSGMATGGSGDVLSGILGGLLAQRGNCELSTCELVTLGVYIHGLCGDLAAEKLGEYSVMASDLLSALPSVMKER